MMLGRWCAKHKEEGKYKELKSNDIGVKNYKVQTPEKST